MTIFFSPATAAFYADEFREDYDAAGTWPADAVEVSDEVWQQFIGTPPAGKIRGAVAGAPAWVNAAPFVPGKPQQITATQFLNRFTPQEQGALATSAQDSPQMLLLLITLAAAGNVDLTDSSVQSGVQGLVTSGILPQARANAIMDH